MKNKIYAILIMGQLTIFLMVVPILFKWYERKFEIDSATSCFTMVVIDTIYIVITMIFIGKYIDNDNSETKP